MAVVIPPDPIVGEIRLFAGLFAPKDWAFCDGRQLSTRIYSSLFQLIGTTYGGDGTNNFAIPDFRGRVPVHEGPGFAVGQKGGMETVTLNTNHLPNHTHAVAGSRNGVSDNPAGGVWAGATAAVYADSPGNLPLNEASLNTFGGSQAHENRIPFLAINYIIALQGNLPGTSVSQYISEIRIFSFPIVPQGWIKCNGQVLPMSGLSQLYSVIGNTYGGDGVNTFALPDLMGRVPMHRGGSILFAKSGGEQKHRLTLTEIPSHTHQVIASSNSPDVSNPSNSFWASKTGFAPYNNDINTKMSAVALSMTGEDIPHENMAPYLVFNICIAISGEFPN